MHTTKVMLLLLLCSIGFLASAQDKQNALSISGSSCFMTEGDIHSVGLMVDYRRLIKKHWQVNIAIETIQGGKLNRIFTNDRTRTLVLNSETSPTTLNFPATYSGSEPYGGLAVLPEKTASTSYNTIKLGVGYRFIDKPRHRLTLNSALILGELQRTFIVSHVTGTFTDAFGNTVPIELNIPFYERLLGWGITPTVSYHYKFKNGLYVGAFIEGDFYIDPILWDRKTGLTVGVQF
jgi:hypothetical protein